MKIYIVYNTSDSEAIPYKEWIDSIYSDKKIAEKRLEVVKQSNGYKWASPRIKVIEVDSVDVDDKVKMD